MSFDKFFSTKSSEIRRARLARLFASFSAHSLKKNSSNHSNLLSFATMVIETKNVFRFPNSTHSVIKQNDRSTYFSIEY